MRPIVAAARRRTALAAVGVTVCGLGLLAPGTAAAVPADPCLATPPANALVGATEGNDQLLGTSGIDVIYGLGGDDVIMGYGGDDVLCGGAGNDGINAGPGNDAVGGGADVDLIVGHDGDDTIYGGTGNDGVYGGNGADTVFVGDDTETDYVGLGPDADPVPGATAADEWHDPIQGDSACPTTTFNTRRLGAYNPPRLKNTGTDDGCQTIRGTIVEKGKAGDGDHGFNVHCTTAGSPCYGGRYFHVELMARDNGHVDPTKLEVGTVARFRGVHIFDDNHKAPYCNDNPACTAAGIRELHPVFAVDHNDDGTWDDYLGPRYAGTPYKVRPLNEAIAGSKRFCWDQLGAACTGFDGGTFG